MTNGKKPNILVIFGDDIGYWNISAYNQGMMGYETPNIDRIAREGMLFTDTYGEQSCTAGRAAFITGQHPYRTGLLKVGMPGAKEGMQPEDPTLAGLLKDRGYATGQFGKNHLGDLDEHLPTAHGFDEFFGNLYHLNAEEEPENEDYPSDKEFPDFKKRFGPRGVMHSKAGGTIEDTGPLTKKRMETVDEEFLGSALNFIDQADADDTPFFVWFNTTRMHIWTHLKEESVGKTGLGIFPDGMVEHDGHVGQLLAKLDELGITEDTIVVYTTDNGAEVMSWPDGGTTPFSGEKNTSWEGGYRIPMVVRWPGVIEPGSRCNEIFSLQDWLPTLLAAAGEPEIKEKLKEGYTANGKDYKVHVDGFNFLPYFNKEVDKGPRDAFVYFTDGGDVAALRFRKWKIIFSEQRAEGVDVWAEPFIALRLPRIFNLRTDPFERAMHESIGYSEWMLNRAFVLVPAQFGIMKFLETFKEFPPRQEVGSFTIDKVLAKMQQNATA
jgi:arylsulfatase A-like enzyme